MQCNSTLKMGLVYEWWQYWMVRVGKVETSCVLSYGYVYLELTGLDRWI